MCVVYFWPRRTTKQKKQYMHPSRSTTRRVEHLQFSSNPHTRQTVSIWRACLFVRIVSCRSYGSMPQHHHHHLLEDEPWRDALHDIASGVWSGSSRAFVIMGTCVYVNLIRPIAAGLLGVHSLPEGRREHVPGGTLKVAVVGFGRTGTVRRCWKRCRKDGLMGSGM